MSDELDNSDGGVLGRVRVQARERSLRFLDFLGAYYSIRYPPVHDIGAYDDLRIGGADLPDAPGITFTQGGDVWLTADLVDSPPVPTVPDGLSNWMQGAITAMAEPTIRHPDLVSRRLIELLIEPVAVDGRPKDLDDLDGGQLASLGIHGITPGEVEAAAVAADDELQDATRELDAWVHPTWELWSTRWQEIERGRAFYKTLFDLRVRMERERDLFEPVWGFGQLRWRPTVEDGTTITVEHPLICVPIELTLEQSTGQIAVSPAGAPEIESSWSAGLRLSDRQGYNEQRSSADQIVLDPWGPEMPKLLRSLLRSIDLDGVIVDAGETVRPSAIATVDPGDWTLFVRRRQLNFRGFLDDQRRLYTDVNAIVPDPFAALVIDEPSSLNSSDPFGAVDTGVHGADTAAESGGERVLLPLPANQQQMQIVFLAQGRAGVTAQGPPGTGKSHTIANLISHYVAHGKRVLVTAEKEQALSVLIDMVPDTIRDLCVPVLGADAAARSRLQATITTIADAAHHRPDRGQISRMESELDSLEARYAATTNALKASRAAETGLAPNQPTGTNAAEWTPSTAAAWLAQSRDGLAGIPDALALGVRSPVTAAEFGELEGLCRSLSQDDATAALAVLPDAGTLPTGAYLARLRLESDNLRQFLATVDDHVTNWEKVDSTSPESLTELASGLQGWAEWHKQIAGTWVTRVLADAADPALLTGWGEFCAGAGSERESALAASRALAAHSVAIATSTLESVPGPEFVRALTDARTRFADGKSLGVMQRAARKALDACSVDGRVPSSVADLDLVFDEITRQTCRQRLSTRWANIVAHIGATPLDGDRPVEDQIGDLVEAARTALSWRSGTWPSFVERLNVIGVRTCVEPAAADLFALGEACRSLVRRARLVAINQELDALTERLRFQRGEDNASPLWGQLADAHGDASDDTWDTLRAEATRLLTLRGDALRRKDLLLTLSSAAPLFALQVAAQEATVDSGRFDEAWAWRQLDGWFDGLDQGPEPSELQALLEQLSKDRRRVATNLVTARAWAAVADTLDDKRRTALNRFTTANAKLGKGTGRYAPMWEAEMRSAMNDAKDAVPVWIMPIHRVIASFRPAEDPPFDVIIVDEASQVGLLEVVVLALAKRAIVVGDDQQTSPENVGTLQQEVFDLIDDHLGIIHDRRTRFAPTNSLYDISRQQFPQVVQLREHFRCLPRIIEFSNHLWYNDSIVPLRDRPPRPGWQPLGSVFVPSGTRRRGDDTNHAEAEAVVALVAEFIADPDYEKKTFGIITLLGSGQAPLISSLLLDRLGPTTIEDRRIRVGDPAGFQGDERDVVILSMVVAHDPDSRIGAMNTAAAARRINVAASRGCDQLWVVHSVGPESLHRDDPRKVLLEHCIMAVENPPSDALFELTESQFERDVLTRILEAGYKRVTPQYPVGGYRIDLVVEGPEGRLAVECDGDYWHGPERWDSDRARQTVLERAGWTFERIRGSAFYRGRKRALEPLWERLDALGIPKGDWAREVGTGSGLHRQWPDDFARPPATLVLTSSLIAADARRKSGTIEEASGPVGSPWDPPMQAGRPTGRDPGSPSTGEVREWAHTRGLRVGDRGRLHPDVIAAWSDAFPDRPYQP